MEKLLAKSIQLEKGRWANVMHGTHGKGLLVPIGARMTDAAHGVRSLYELVF